MPVAAPRNSAMVFRIVETIVAWFLSYPAGAVVVVIVEHSVVAVCCGGCGESQAQMWVMIRSSDFKQMMGFRYLKLLEVN